MKGVKTASFANGTATRFQVDHLLANRITLDGYTLQEQFEALKKQLNEMDGLKLIIKQQENKVKQLEDKVKELGDKVESFETEAVMTE